MFTHPSKLLILWTCVSTAIAGVLNARFSTKFAVFIPTPGKVSSWLFVLGIVPLKFVEIKFVSSFNCLALVL